MESSSSAGEKQPAPLPVPKRTVVHSGRLRVGGGLSVRWSGARTDRLDSAAERADRAVAALMRGKPAGAPLSVDIRCEATAEAHPQLGDAERYRLHVDADGAHLSAPSEWGVLHGLVTLVQLVSPAGEIGFCEIDDAPRFLWRGLLLDVARHFIGVAALRRTLDGMALCKLNVLHLHLTDDQAFRFPSRRFPRLASRPHFTRAELVSLVSYAADRGIRVVPELDVPGHTSCWLAAYPEWGSETTGPSRRFGVHEACLDPTSEDVYAALDGLLHEVTEVFPDRFVHIGGDEVNPLWWSRSESVRRYMAQRHIADVAELQAHFTSRLVAATARLGRVCMAWDEALHPRLPQGVTVQAWRGATARNRALSRGHDCVVSANYYLDLMFPADVHYGFDPEADEASLVGQEDSLLEDPRFAHVAEGMRWTNHWRESAALRADGSGRLLGAEACLWGELVDESVLDARLWSRLPAVAERFWSPAHVTDVGDLYARMPACLHRLAAIAEIDVRASSADVIGNAGVTEQWRPLIEQLEPVKWYGRLLGEQALAARIAGTEMPLSRPYDADTPLNRVVDGLLPESPHALAVAEACHRHAAGDRAAASTLRDHAQTWRALRHQSGCVAELKSAAQRLADLGDLVLGVLDGTLSRSAARKILDAAAVPQGEYLIAVVPALRSWIETTAP